jgi:signal transduction histidine kinase
MIQYAKKKTRNREPFQIEVLNYKKNGEVYWADVSCQPVFDAQGRLQHFFSIATDTTERKRLQQILDEEKDKRQQMITAATIAAQEMERAQVGQELHDNVNQVLTTVKLYTELCRDGIGNATEIMDKSITLLQNSIDEIRSLSKRLSAPSLGKIKLKDSIKDLVETITATNKITIGVRASDIDNLEVSHEVHLALYRILQEHFTNVLKHADAKCVQLNMDLKNEQLHLNVSDDGKGFDTTQKRKGIGITNMLTRAQSLKGSLVIISAPGKGCQLHVQIPVMTSV